MKPADADVPTLIRRAVRSVDPITALIELAKRHRPRTLLFHLAALQDGQYAAVQAKAVGFSPNARRWLTRSGRATPVVTGVARLAGAAGSPDPAITAFLRCWPVATIGHTSAAHHHGLVDEPPERPQLVVPHGCHRRPAGIEVHQTRHLPATDRKFVGTVAYTSLARTVCDLASAQDHHSTLARVDDAVAAGASPRWLHQRSSQLSIGRDGAAIVRDATAPGAAPAFRSWLERMTALLILHAGLPAPAWNVPVRDRDGAIGVVDALWETYRVVVEVEGLRFHTSPRARRRDAGRFNRLLTAGFVVRRFTWHDVVEQPGDTAQAIAQALLHAGAPVDPASVSRSAAARRGSPPAGRC